MLFLESLNMLISVCVYVLHVCMCEYVSVCMYVSMSNLAMTSQVLDMKCDLDFMLEGSDDCKFATAQYRLIFNAPGLG